jgi:diguanylate cyclase (GGDEF)-like protein/PAS domain S-box-containing protein
MNSHEQLLIENKRLRAELDSINQQNKQNDIKHAKNDERLNYVLHEAVDGIWDWDIVTNEVCYSARWKEMLGYQEHELVGHLDTWASLVHPNDKDHVLQKIEDYLSGVESAFEVEMRMRHKQGHFLFIRTRALQLTCNLNNEPIRLVGTHVDITQRKKAELFEKRYTKILKMIAQGNPASQIYNEIAYTYEERHSGIRCSMLELDGNTLLHGGAPSLPTAYCAAVNGLVNGPDIGSCGTSTYTGKRVLVENIETDIKWVNLKSFALPHGMRSCWSEPIVGSNGKVLGAFGMYRDYPSLPNKMESDDLMSAARLAGIIMERDHNQKRIKTLAYQDELTGLSSRAHLLITLENLIKSSVRYNEKFSLLYIDLDNFKSVNDSLGHDIGDLLLIEIGSRLSAISRDADCIARLGGDEFCIIVKDINNSYNAAAVAQRSIEAVSKFFELSGRMFVPACSIGIARYPDDGKDLKTLLKAADIALYAAKDNGKNCYHYYNRELTKVAEYQFKVEEYLRDAIENHQLTLAYQPQIDIKSGKIIGVEALSRWHHLELGQVPPTDFIATAERIGMIKPLTEWVLDTACKQAVLWRELGLPAVNIAVNISPSHLFDDDFILLLKSVIARTGVVSSDLELEITESVVQTNQNNLSIFQHLKKLGVLLAVDDFGTGYSSFASLKHLNVDCLKIDKYFVNDMITDEKTKLLINSMIEMGHNLGYKIIAEGVETVEQLRILETFNCDIAQGYLFSKPVDAETMTTLFNLNSG